MLTSKRIQRQGKSRYYYNYFAIAIVLHRLGVRKDGR